MSASESLAAGQPAPSFSLVATDGGTVTLSDFAGKQHVVLYFYPKDDTPGCTVEACSFRDLNGQFAEAGAVILGVSPDDIASHQAFTAKFGLPFPLLADPDHAVATAYGVYGPKVLYGKEQMGITRSTFVIDRAGTIQKIYRRVKVEEHAEQVLDVVRSLA